MLQCGEKQNQTNVLLFEKNREEVLSRSHRRLIGVGDQHVLIHLEKKKHVSCECLRQSVIVLCHCICPSPSRIPQMCPCHWGDGPHTGSAAAPELSPSGCTVARRRHRSCLACEHKTHEPCFHYDAGKMIISLACMFLRGWGMGDAVRGVVCVHG